MQPHDLSDGLTEYLTFEREALLVENINLQSQNSALLVGQVNLNEEVQRLRAVIQAGLNALTGSNTTHRNLTPSLPSSVPPPAAVPMSISPLTCSFNLDAFPNEILTEILRHLHQPFHFYHYSNALLGVSNPPPGSRPWNPIKLQLVCRRWKYVARPLFYRQVAFNFRDEATLNLALDITEDMWEHPLAYSRDSVWIDVHPSYEDLDSDFEEDDDEVFSDLQVNVSRQVETNARFVALASTGASSFFSGRTFLERTFILGNSSLEDAGDVLRIVGRNWDDSGEWIKPGLSAGVHPNQLLTLRLPPYDIPTTLTSILNSFGNIPYVPRFQLDLPFPLTPSLLNTIFPTLTSILQHPSLPEGRDFIFKHTGNPKKILFGTKSEKDASVLQGRIEELGGLEVVVEVVVLEL
ncbi:hypothetical protein BDY24DRAFT_392783 [Mrakia frigida]|uniref:uncharacterized protein n=1 Tax=Mrakia frigida TaxID=29902 RepID=UPI003FCBF827